MFYYEYGFGWGTLSLINAGLAQLQGRSTTIVPGTTVWC
jgi:hypothetical protein